MKPSGFASWRVSAVSYGEAVLHVPKARFIYRISPLRLTMKHCSAHAPQYEAAPLRSAMKLSRSASMVDVVLPSAADAA